MAKMQASQAKSEILWGCTIDAPAEPLFHFPTRSVVVFGMSLGLVK